MLRSFAIFIGHKTAQASRVLYGKRGAATPVEVLSWLVQFLPNAQGEEIFSALARGFLLAFNLHVCVIASDSKGEGHVFSSGLDVSDSDREALRITLREGRVSGYGTELSAKSSWLFVPLYASSTVTGALGFKADPRLPELVCPGSPVFRAFCGQAALSILRTRLSLQAQHALVLQEADRLQKALLSSISHNVRTPIASIIGSLTTLRDEFALLDEPTRRDLIENALSETGRLNRLLGNLLDLGRLEAGALQVRMDPCDVQDVIGAAVEQLGSAMSNRLLCVELQPDLPFVRMDFVLIVQVMVNLLDNALKYSSEQDPIIVDARVQADQLTVQVLDAGDGIPNHELTKVFEKFNRAGRTGETGGVGLGLSICRGLIEAHHGKIWAEHREPRGTALIFTLPYEPGRQGGS